MGAARTTSPSWWSGATESSPACHDRGRLRRCQANGDSRAIAGLAESPGLREVSHCRSRWKPVSPRRSNLSLPLACIALAAVHAHRGHHPGARRGPGCAWSRSRLSRVSGMDSGLRPLLSGCVCRDPVPTLHTHDLHGVAHAQAAAQCRSEFARHSPPPRLRAPTVSGKSPGRHARQRHPGESRRKPGSILLCLLKQPDAPEAQWIPAFAGMDEQRRRKPYLPAMTAALNVGAPATFSARRRQLSPDGSGLWPR